MERLRKFSRQTTAGSKLKYWLCAAGVIIIMSVLAAMPPISKNNQAGTKPAAAAKRLNGGISLSAGRAYVQTAAAAGQGGTSSVQGTTSLGAAISTQPTTAPPSAPARFPCNACGGRGVMCPDIAGACSGCGNSGASACPMEE